MWDFLRDSLVFNSLYVYEPFYSTGFYIHHDVGHAIEMFNFSVSVYPPLPINIHYSINGFHVPSRFVSAQVFIMIKLCEPLLSSGNDMK